MSLLRLLGSKASVPAKTKPTLQRTAPSRVLLACPSSRTIATASARPQEAPREPPSATPEIDLLQSRRRRIRESKPFSDFLTDTFHRQHDYLRISVSERCNLRCVYCMPEEGVPLSPNRELLTTPEIVLLSSVFVSQGVTKIRLTGGEPTVRRDILPLMQQIGELRRHGLKEICITTNGISLHRKLDSMIESGLTGVNLSLDTLDPWQFQIMTRRKGFEAVQKSIDRILELNRLGAGIKLKINCVVMRGVNDREVLPFVGLTEEKDVEVRFIEYMPFDGNKWSKNKMFSYQEMLDLIRTKYPTLQKVQDHKNDTSKTWHVPGFTGRIGFITSMTHNFCGTCNRLRITGDGNLKVCLFGNAEVSLRDILRKSNSGEPIDEQAFDAMRQIEMDRRRDLLTPDRTPLGLAPNEMELLKVIGAAVKRKKAKHAGIGELEHMKNRPMILIGG
ncbi:molybdenum cofactor biosynthesis 1 A [Fusarium mundagurra]|uniref:GTP 3',8-cyclase n=1 Tax=Fusarium mundagurra TaxID=1567541 RepID=A0A8H5YL24_9HYPO|nr:molybdenum cofactor biosynthesis 1 A [Fusarium mundagurra]